MLISVLILASSTVIGELNAGRSRRTSFDNDILVLINCLIYSICCSIDVMIVSIDIIGDWIVFVRLNVHPEFHVV